MGFEPAIPARTRPQAHALNRTDIVISTPLSIIVKNNYLHVRFLHYSATKKLRTFLTAILRKKLPIYAFPDQATF
jgi:hypothetical protein